MAVGVLAAIHAAEVSAGPIDTPDRSASLHQVSWTQKDGAPILPTDMAQTTDGLLWLSAATGLYRFDARHFERIEVPGAPEPELTLLFASRDGGLWIGYLFNSVAYLKDGNLRAYGTADGLPGGGVLSFTQESDGTMWAGTTRGLARWRGQRWETLDDSWKWPGGPAKKVLADSQGRVWIHGEDRIFVVAPRGHETVAVPGSFPSDTDLLESADGTVWAATAAGLWRLGTGPATGHVRWSSPTSVLADEDGTLWLRPSFHTLRSATRLLSAASTPPQSIAFQQPMDADPSDPQGWGDTLLLDRDGNLWARTRTSVVRYSPRRFLSLKSLLGWRETQVGIRMATAPVGAAGLVFADSSHFGAAAFDGQVAHALPPTSAIKCAAPGQGGTAWLADRQKLWHVTAGRTESLDLPVAMRGSDIVAMREDREGGVWLGGLHTGLYRFAAGTWTVKGGVPALPDGQVMAIAGDPAGRLWFAYSSGQVALIDEGRRVRVLGPEDGVHVGHVFALFARRGTLWIAGDAGLAQYDGHRVRTIAVDGANVLYNITGVVQAEGGDVWLNTGAGVVRLPAEELALASTRPGHRIWSELFDALDGIEGTSSQYRPLPTLVEGADGRLWASTNEDVYGIDPHHLARRPVTPVAIQAFVVDDRPYPVVDPPLLPRRAGTLKIGYGGGSLSAADKVRYRYRLDGVDDDWHSVLDRREATYMNLAPGRYRFRVQDTWAGLPWPTAETTLVFEIPPAFAQTGWFFALCAVASGVLLWHIVQWRARQLAKPMRIRLEARLAERLRIARDLHDTLLQSVQGFILFVHGAASRLEPTHPVRMDLDRALDAGQSGLREGRERVLDLRLNAGLSESLVDSFQVIAAQLLARDQSIKFDIEERGSPRPLHLSVQEEVYCIGREALVNAFRHAQAASIELTLTYGADAFTLLIRDDGHGIAEGADAVSGVAGHWGLKGMAERAQIIGAVLELRRREGGGTQVWLRIPGRRAYASKNWVRTLSKHLPARWVGTTDEPEREP